MPYDLDTLKATRDAIADRLLEAHQSPKPEYTENGLTVRWPDYIAMLADQLKTLNDLVSNEEGGEGMEDTITVTG